jgi:2-polyprenyl-3-methyl-5-hydroxy-6-metoxy-1,4-benzoquinol methylase
MEHPDPAVFLAREFWDERYGDKPIWSGDPNSQLVHYAADLPPGAALDAGSGEGGDALRLAARGWTVTGADISDRPGKDADDNPVTLHDAVLHAVRH